MKSPVTTSLTPVLRGAVHGLALAVRDPAAGWLVIRMLAWRAALPVLERLLPLPRLVRLMAARPYVRRDRAGRAEGIVDLAERVFDLGRSHENCLERSMVTYRYLSKTGAEPQLVLAVRKGTAPARGHAWVTVDGMPVHDSPSLLRDFESLVTFGSSGHMRSADPSENAAA